jgi:hypothetical protein
MSELPVDEARVAALETRFAVHDAVCGERYRAINFKLNIAIGGIGILLTAISAGDPLVLFLRRVFGAA